MAKKDIPDTCPRCREGTTRLLSTSAKKGVWSMCGCDTCFYSWRSTEPAGNTDPDQYPAIFRLTPDEIPDLRVVPTIPPLQKRG